jgi:hypothetical protein
MAADYPTPHRHAFRPTVVPAGEEPKRKPRYDHVRRQRTLAVVAGLHASKA